MKQRHSQTASAARPAAALVCLCLLLLLLSFAGCRKEQATTTNNAATAANANAAPTQSSGETKCGVPYYPVRAGLEKQYRITYERNSAPPTLYTESYAIIQPDWFSLRYQSDRLSVDTGWNCTPEGMIALEYGKFNSAGHSTSFSLETVGRSGVTVPAAERWRVGEEWRSSYEIKTEFIGIQRPGGHGSGTIEITNRIIAREQVTVPAGTYDALKVESTMAMKLILRAGQMTVPTSRSARNVTWFAENVGMVRAVSTGDFEGAITELVSLKQ